MIAPNNSLVPIQLTRGDAHVQRFQIETRTQVGICCVELDIRKIDDIKTLTHRNEEAKTSDVECRYTKDNVKKEMEES